jgi:hypothetical protein
VILIGQPELYQFLKRSELCQVAQRITARYHLNVFSAEESYAYISHRVKTAGGGETLFTPGALRQGRGRLRDIKTDKHELRGHRDLLDARPTLQDTGSTGPVSCASCARGRRDDPRSPMISKIRGATVYHAYTLPWVLPIIINGAQNHLPPAERVV